MNDSATKASHLIMQYVVIFEGNHKEFKKDSGITEKVLDALNIPVNIVSMAAQCASNDIDNTISNLVTLHAVMSHGRGKGKLATHEHIVHHQEIKQLIEDKIIK